MPCNVIYSYITGYCTEDYFRAVSNPPLALPISSSFCEPPYLSRSRARTENDWILPDLSCFSFVVENKFGVEWGRVSQAGNGQFTLHGWQNAFIAVWAYARKIRKFASSGTLWSSIGRGGRIQVYLRFKAGTANFITDTVFRTRVTLYYHLDVLFDI